MKKSTSMKKTAVQKNSDNTALATRIAISYSVFLFLCLVLFVVVYMSFTGNAEENFWQQRSVRLQSNISTMDNYISTMDSYTSQLLNDSTFVRFANMKSITERRYIITADEIMRELSSRLFSLTNLPVTYTNVYLKNVGYVISASQFTEARQYYRTYRNLIDYHYEQWLNSLLGSDGVGRNIPMAPYNGLKDTYMLVRDIDDILPRSVPAVIWFEWDMQKIRDLFITADAGNEAFVLIVDEDGAEQMRVGASKPNEALILTLTSLSYNEDGYASTQGLRIIKRASNVNNWSYLLALPEELCQNTLGNYDLIFVAVLLMAALGGALLVTMMVRRNMRPIVQLGTQLEQAEGDRALLQQEVDSNRPAVCTSYVRKIMSGHVASGDEYEYIMNFLGLKGNLKFTVLYCVVYNHLEATLDPTQMNELLSNALPAFLETNHPVYFYSSLMDTYAVLVTYDANEEDPLMDMMDIQSRVLALHDHLLMEHSLWFYAGVGKSCTQPINLWESYEQARTAARYTAKHHIFLPYEVIQKDSQSAYYPIEISAKLLHFITTGNTVQVREMFALIHRENIEERALPINMLNFLLSDIRNTLLKARFSITSPIMGNEDLLVSLDKQLNQQSTFALCESIALSLCGFFRETTDSNDPIPEIEQYLRDNYTDPSMCLNKLSDLFQISESYLSHLFKEKTGQNFSVYLENLRLNEAMNRLKDKDCNLTVLYMDLGYNNATTFRRAFKKRYGVPPSAVRDS